ncbi:MFS transporter [Halobacillus kuroshimensis]|uniref:MFS transporter n=1 Tax=Halobacillus kuroshimensis TaxID=302481 RepID=UPI000425EA87|nr:MFS transporter [Halobacillus kuroshimensis]
MKEISTKVYIALTALAVSAFAIGTTEFVIVGLLPTVASDLGITVTKAGTLISGYAVAIAIGTPVVTAVTSRIPKKFFLLLLLMVFSAGNAAAAIAQTYELLLAARVVTAVAHGVFFAVAATVAADLVPEHKRGSAISIMFTGLTVATIAGVPMGTYIGQNAGWRVTFIVVAVLGLLGLVTTFFAVDRIAKSTTGPKVGDIIVLVKHPKIVSSLMMTALGFGGTFTIFTYMTPILEEVSGHPSDWISLLLLIYGVAVAIGNILGGKWADGHPVKALRYIFGVQAVVLLLQMLLLPNRILSIVSIVLLGLFAFMMSPGVQSYIVTLAEKLAPSAKDLASAFNIAAFNVGIAAGSALGGMAVNRFTPLDAAWMGALMAAAACVLAVWNTKSDRKQFI